MVSARLLELFYKTIYAFVGVDFDYIFAFFCGY